MRLLELKYLILALFLAVSSIVQVEASTYYFRVTAKSQPSALGKVYVSDKETINPSFASVESTSDGSGSENYKEFYLYAQCDNPDYNFVSWRTDKDDPQTEITSGFNTSYSFYSDSENKNSPAVYTIYACFLKSWVNVSSSGSSNQVKIDQPAYGNAEGDVVTITAFVNDGYEFVGWKKKGTGDDAILSRQNPYTLTVTEQIEYQPVVKESETLANNFYRIYRYVNGQKSYLTLVDDDFNYTDIVTAGRGLRHILEPDNTLAAINAAKGYLKKDFQLGSDVSNPGTVIYVKNGKDFYAQGTKLSYVTKGYACTSPTIRNVLVESQYANTKVISYNAENQKEYTITLPMTVSDNDLGILVFCVDDSYTLDAVREVTNQDSQKWCFEPIDNAANSFYVIPNLRDVNGKYYTSLRAGFSFKVKNSDKVSVYKVASFDENGEAILEKYANGAVIPASMPVILECMSQNSVDNILVPVEPQALESTQVATGLYDDYGYRQHTYHDEAQSNNNIDTRTEDGIGYFKVKYTKASTVPIYKLDVKDGKVGFWTLVAQDEVISGNEAYSYTPCALFLNRPEFADITLAELIESGDTEGKYSITDVWAKGVEQLDEGKLITCKDQNGYTTKDAMPNPIPENETWVDYMQASSATIQSDLDYSVPETYDQSNWIVLRMPEGQQLSGDAMTTMQDCRLTNVKGRLVDAVNPEFQLETVPTPIQDDKDKDKSALNVFVAASFGGTQHSTVNDRYYFFVQPKPMERAYIGWAQWDGEKFVAPVANENNPGWNQAELNGEFAYNSLYQTWNAEVPEQDHIYKMEGLVKLAVPATGRAPRRAQGDAKSYEVYPLYLTKTSTVIDGVITGVAGVTGSHEVAGVDYINLAGQRSSRPWQGVNIVVTRYTDGTIQTQKQVH